MSNVNNNAMECPDWLSRLCKDELPNEIKPKMFWDDMVGRLNKAGALHLVSPTFIARYALSNSRHLEIEIHISQALSDYASNENFPDGYPKGLPKVIDASLMYAEQAHAAEDMIWQMASRKSWCASG